MAYLHLPPVDEMEHVLQVVQLDVGGHHHHGVGAGVLTEHHLEVG